ncbi:MAG: hypothetical protein U0641_07080 [Anaerolineae bacterium]
MTDLHFIPEPSLIERRHGSFPLTAATRLLVAPDASPESRFAAGDLAAAIQRVTGLTPPIETTPEETEQRHPPGSRPHGSGAGDMSWRSARAAAPSQPR